MALPDTSHLRTYIGPYPPARPKDTRTWIWSKCDRCPWTVCYLEDRNSMRYTIEFWEHAEQGCGPGEVPAQDDGGPAGQIALFASDPAGQLALFG
ncbi:hypothetical protein [Actinacidiphila sp. bgisy160]|uniref:hypothetical protein n=1 Tax=Actinacidiphila sp. bgisy160 TaxID=3413796 RepID=UPI003D712614